MGIAKARLKKKIRKAKARQAYKEIRALKVDIRKSRKSSYKHFNHSCWHFYAEEVLMIPGYWRSNSIFFDSLLFNWGFSYDKLKSTFRRKRVT